MDIDSAKVFAIEGKKQGLTPTAALFQMLKLGASLQIARNAIAEQYNEKPVFFPEQTLDTLELYEPEPGDYIAGAGFLRKGAACLLAGSTGIGKTILENQVALQVAVGEPILDRIFVGQPSKVTIVQAENDLDTMKRDIPGIVGELDLDRDLIQKNLSIFHAYGVTGEKFVAWLDCVAAKHKPDLIIIDPYQSYVGGQDLNSSQSFLSWVSPIDELLKKHHCALLLVAHTPKPRERDSWNIRDMVYSAAGTSTIANWARTSMELSPAGHETSRFRLTFGKNAERTGIIDESGHVCRELYIEHSGNISKPFWRVSEDQGAPCRSKYTEDIAAYFKSNPAASLREVAEHVGCSKDTVSKIKKQLDVGGVCRLPPKGE